MSGGTTLIIEKLSGERVAEVKMRDGPTVISVAEGLREEVDRALDELVSAGPAIREFRSERTDEDEERHVQVAREVEPGDEDYLRALADGLMRHRIRIDDELVRGVIRER